MLISMAPEYQGEWRPGASLFDRGHASTGGLLLPAPKPLITYGKKDTRPLPLSANHLRRNIRALLPQESAIGHESGEDDNRQFEASTHAKELPSNQSLDSESELSAGSDSAANPTTIEAGWSPAANHSLPLDAIEAAKEKCIDKSSRALEPKRKTKISAPRLAKSDVKASTNRRVAPGSNRRLPVNELVLVRSPVHEAPVETPSSSHSGCGTQDPINDKGSSPLKRSAPPVDANPIDAVEQPSRPLSVFKHRLGVRKPRHKSLGDLRKKYISHTVDIAPGDGFEEAEMYVSPLARKKAKLRPRQCALLSGFNALQLQSGPLPEVEFTSETSCLTTQSGTQLPADPAPEVAVQAGAETQVSQKSIRRVSFCDDLREATIRAQLSSLTAPPKPRVEFTHDDSDRDSDGCEAQQDGEDDEHDAATDADGEAIVEGFEAVADDADGDAGATDQSNSIGTTHYQVDSLNKDREKMLREPDEGVTLDFRHSLPGFASRRIMRPHSLIEVNESIVEVPEVAAHYVHSEIQTANEEPIPIPMPLHDHVTGRPSLRRPRSILKQSSQVIPDSTTEPRHTAANTRRNSLVEIGESRYFTDAADMLRRTDPAKHSIVPRRRSSHWSEVEMLDSEAVIPETSPSRDLERLDYSNPTSLAALKRGSEVEWTSQSMPSADPRDLSSLTRSVSREHGTLSQSVRRQSSMHFRSPRKIREE